MASRAIQSLLASSHQRSRPDRIVVRVGAAAAWLAAAIYLVTGVFTGDGSLFVEALGPILAAVLMTFQVLAGREEGGTAILGTGLIVALWHTMFGDSATVLPAAVGLVLVSSLGMLFVARHRMVVAATVGGGLFGIPHLWDLAVDQRIVLGVIMAVTFVVTYLVLGAIQSASAALDQRYQILFEQSPSAVLEEDWSEAIAYVQSEYTGKPNRIRQFLLAYPAIVERAVGKAKIVRANDAALELLDIADPVRFLGYRDPKIVNDENIESFVSALVCLYEGGKVWQREVPIRRRSGDLLWLLYRSVDTSTGAPGSSIVAGLADITHMKAKHEAMAEVVRAKDEFVANVSHELRTPLTAVIGLTSELAAGGESMGAEMRSEMLQLVADQANEMSNIVEDLLVAARAEVGTIPVGTEPVDLLDELRLTVGGLGVGVELPANAPPRVLADPKRVRQILRNLITNAERYGGPSRRVIAGADDGRAWLEARDDGDGIPAEEVARIFEPYVTTGVGGSVGLGLSVARQLAELMGGSLEYEYISGESVFRLSLPLADRTEPVLASHTEQR